MKNLSQYGRKWTRDETILALGLYFQIPFAKISSRKPRDSQTCAINEEVSRIAFNEDGQSRAI